MEGIDVAFPFMKVPARSPRPRNSGLTIVSDRSLATQEARNLMETSAELIDYVKFTDHPANIGRHSPAWLKSKLAIYHEHGIKALPGGVTFEVAALQRQVEPFMRRLRELGFDAVEISEDVIPPMPPEVRLSYIALAQRIGLDAFTEVGKKDPEAPLNAEDAIEAIRRDLEAGARKVTIENSDIVLLMKTDPAPIHRIVEAVGLKQIVFEVGPHSWPQVATWVIRTFGPEVNLENLGPEWLATLDAMRRGMNRNVNYEFLSRRGGVVG